MVRTIDIRFCLQGINYDLGMRLSKHHVPKNDLEWIEKRIQRLKAQVLAVEKFNKSSRRNEHDEPNRIRTSTTRRKITRPKANFTEDVLLVRARG